MTVHDCLKTLPRLHLCPICGHYVTKWHEHHGPKRRWKPGMEKVLVHPKDVVEPDFYPGVTAEDVLAGD